MSEFQSVVDAEQQNGVPQKKRPLAENEKPTSRTNQEQGIDKSRKRRKGVGIRSIAVGVEAREDACEKKTYKRELYAK